MNKQIQAIRAEIERRINEITEMGEAGVVRLQELETLVGLETYLDTLQEQEPEVDLEKEIDEFWSRLSEEGTTFDMIEETARHFYELGQASVPMPEEQPSKDLEEAAEEYEKERLSDYGYRGEWSGAFIAGAEWMKKQMEDE